LQRQGELRRLRGPGLEIPSPEKVLAASLATSLKCDFATDVWCLGLLLHELVCGVPWEAARASEDISEELLTGKAIMLPHLEAMEQREGRTAQEVEEDEAVKVLVARMLTKHPMQRPVVDVVLQEAASKLYAAHDLEPPVTATVVSPSSTKQRVASPPSQRPCSGSTAITPNGWNSTVREDPAERDVWGEGEDGGVVWDGSGATGKLVGGVETELATTAPACSCRCVLM